MGRVHGKVAIVTGAASGLGAATARMLAREGASVVVTDINDAEVEHGQHAVTAAGGIALHLRHDVTDEQAWQRVISAT